MHKHLALMVAHVLTVTNFHSVPGHLHDNSCQAYVLSRPQFAKLLFSDAKLDCSHASSSFLGQAAGLNWSC